MASAREHGDQLLQRLLEHTARSLGAVGAGVSLVEGLPRSVSAVGVATRLDAAQWAVGEGPLWVALREGRGVVGPEPGDRGRPLDRYPAVVDRAGPEVIGTVGGLVVAPGEWGGDDPLLLTIYLDRPAESDDLAAVDEYESLLGGALAVVEYCIGEELRAGQMLQMVQYRRVIEQAKGLVMAATGGDAAAAFTTLSRASQHFNLRLRNLAVALVEHVGGSPAEGPENPGEVVVPSEAERRTVARIWLALTSGPGGPAARLGGRAGVPR